MWIRTQNKERNIDSHNHYIDIITNYNNSKCYYIKEDLGRDNNPILGEYSTQEKALKVLDEIHKRIDVFNSFECVTTEYVYQMPQDDEVK